MANSLPALNLGTLRALILITAPVCGLRPLRAARSDTENVPKPTSVTLSPFFSDVITVLVNESSASLACDFVTPASFAILSINSALFILFCFCCEMICFEDRQKYSPLSHHQIIPQLFFYPKPLPVAGFRRLCLTNSSENAAKPMLGAPYSRLSGNLPLIAAISYDQQLTCYTSCITERKAMNLPPNSCIPLSLICCEYSSIYFLYSSMVLQKYCAE